MMSIYYCYHHRYDDVMCFWFRGFVLGDGEGREGEGARISRQVATRRRRLYWGKAVKRRTQLCFPPTAPRPRRRCTLTVWTTGRDHPGNWVCPAAATARSRPDTSTEIRFPSVSGRGKKDKKKNYCQWNKTTNDKIKTKYESFYNEEWFVVDIELT